MWIELQLQDTTSKTGSPYNLDHDEYQKYVYHFEFGGHICRIRNDQRTSS
jgi:hypothetical protein